MKTKLAVRTRPSSTKLLARVLDTPDLAEELRALPPAALAKLIEHVGLEDAGELVALATTEQLSQVFDEDLWKNPRPGEEERFDGARFVLWLEALLEAGDSVVAARLSELPEDFVALAFSRQILVIPLENLRSELEEEGEDADFTEKALENHLSEEFDEFIVVARRSEGWDAVLAALVALDRDHHAVLSRLLERAAAASSSYIDDHGGLYDVLSSEEMLENDVAAERSDRRALAGYVSPRDAAAFLKLARAAGETAFTQHDPLTRAYFRDVDRTRVAAPPPAPEPRPKTELLTLLQAAGVTERPAPRLLPAGADSGDAAAGPAFVRSMQLLRERDPSRFAERSEELAYLANVLVAAATVSGRRVRPIEAVRAAVTLCSAGLEALLPDEPQGTLEAHLAALIEHPADGLFRLGVRKLERRLGGGVPDLAKILND